MAARKAASKSNGNGSHATKRSAIADGIAHFKSRNDEIRKAVEALQKHAFRPTKTGMTALTALLRMWSEEARALDAIAVPMFREAGVEEKIITESEMERDLAAFVLVGLTRMDKEAAEFAPLVGLVLRRMAAIMAQEEADDGLFAKAEEAEVDKAELGKRLQQDAAEQDQRAEEPYLLPQPRHLRGAVLMHSKEFEDMRGNERERDDHGRFVSDDDERQGRYQSRPMASRRGSSRYDDDEDHRGWYGDARGHSEASQRGWDHRRSEGRSRGGRYEDDDGERYQSRSRASRADYDDRRGYSRHGGWFGDSEGHAQAARRGWDNPDHGPSGWYGDSEGHSQASQRGWDNPDHGPSGWYGDREGHSRASQRGWDNPNHGPSGWYGDSEGHSEASRRGWDERRSSPSRRYQDDDDYDRRRSMRRR